MIFLSIFLLSCVLFLLIFFYFQYLRPLSRIMPATERYNGALIHKRLQPGDDEDSNNAYTAAYLLSIEIKDPIGIAQKESRLARMLTEHAPNFIIGQVYQHVRKEIKETMKARGIDATIRTISL